MREGLVLSLDNGELHSAHRCWGSEVGNQRVFTGHWGSPSTWRCHRTFNNYKHWWSGCWAVCSIDDFCNMVYIGRLYHKISHKKSIPCTWSASNDVTACSTYKAWNCWGVAYVVSSLSVSLCKKTSNEYVNSESSPCSYSFVFWRIRKEQAPIAHQNHIIESVECRVSRYAKTDGNWRVKKDKCDGFGIWNVP